MKTKVNFTLSTGFPPVIEEEYTLEELDIDPLDEDIEEKLEELWFEWSSNYIDGGWRFVKNEGETE